MKKIILIGISSVILTSCANMNTYSFAKAKEYCLSQGGEYKSVATVVNGHNGYTSKCELPNGESVDLFNLYSTRPVVSSGIFDGI
ncbi:DUF333 domain-containing protein [Orbaceae bacterium ac157xtp]